MARSLRRRASRLGTAFGPLAVCIALLSGVAIAQDNTRSTTEDVQEAVAAFIAVFNDLDWEPFRKSFADDATVFFPFAGVPRRTTGRVDYEREFKAFFDTVRQEGSAPPYLSIEPKDTAVQVFGDIAVVTFHLEAPGRLNRRTVVLNRRDARWLIVHLHASRMSSNP